MSIWQSHSIEAPIREILASVPLDGHHFGRPFLTAYQIAIAFEQLSRSGDREAARHGRPRLGVQQRPSRGQIFDMEQVAGLARHSRVSSTLATTSAPCLGRSPHAEIRNLNMYIHTVIVKGECQANARWDFHTPPLHPSVGRSPSGPGCRTAYRASFRVSAHAGFHPYRRHDAPLPPPRARAVPRSPSAHRRPTTRTTDGIRALTDASYPVSHPLPAARLHPRSAPRRTPCLPCGDRPRVPREKCSPRPWGSYARGADQVGQRDS